MEKKKARELYRQKRAALTEMERVKLDDLMLIQFQTLQLPFLHAIMSYWPIEENHEPDTHLYTEFLKFRNPELKICYPVSDFETLTMQAAVTDIDTPFNKREHNIHEPETNHFLLAGDLDLVMVPLIAFDRKGYRVGYGKGFYDKFLAACRQDCLFAGFSYFEPIDQLKDRHEFDVPLSFCITPQNVYVF